MSDNERVTKNLRHDVWLRILTLASIALLVWGFVLPPPGVIDSSVIAAVGELAGFAALWQLAKAIDKGVVRIYCVTIPNAYSHARN